MNVFELTRALVDIDSVTPNETAVGDFLFDVCSELASRTGGVTERMPVEQGRDNILVYWGDIIVTMSTHMDTVPPFTPSQEDSMYIYGRGSCDAKGIIASMLCAAERLAKASVRGFACLFVVGEERNSAGALAAAKWPRGSSFLINGEPTENKLALGTKGSLRYEIEAHGRAAHSAYPHLGESAIEQLLDALMKLRGMRHQSDPVLGKGTLNIGTIRGGRAPNVIPDEAMAEVHIRLVDDGAATRSAVLEAVGQKAKAKEILCIPAVRLMTVPGYETEVMAYTTDIPAFGGAWGEPMLIGPGSIHVAHTSEECVAKTQLTASVDIYERLVQQLMSRAPTAADF